MNRWRSRARLAVDGFTGLVVASVGVALAGLTWRLAGNTGVAPVAATVAGTAGAPVDIAGLLALAPFGTVAAASDTASDGSLHLKGILLAVPASASTALIAGADGKVAGYGIGAALGGGVVAAIAGDQVVLRTPRGLQTLAFAPATRPSVATPGAADAIAGFVRASGIASSPVSATAPIPAPAGYRIDGSTPAALLNAGLQPGDIVEQINGMPVTPGMSAAVIARNLGGAALGSAQVVVLRNGSRLSLRLAIR